MFHRFTLLALMLSTPVFAENITVGHPFAAGLTVIPVTIVAECTVFEHGNYPGDWDLLVSCPDLDLTKVTASLKRVLLDYTILTVESDGDAVASVFLTGATPEVHTVVKLPNDDVKAGPLQVKGHLKVIAVRK